MNACFVLAGGLALAVCLAHSILGEIFLIRRLTRDGLPPLTPYSLVPTPLFAGSADLARRTLRFTWHLAAVFGSGFAAILLCLSVSSSPDGRLGFVEQAVALSFLGASLIVLFVSRGKHPGWVGLLGVAVLTWLGGM